MNPLTGLTSSAGMMNRFAYDQLVHTTVDGKLVSGVAQTWTTDADSTTFTLKPGVLCGDGVPLHASDVAAQYNWISDPANQSPLLGLSVPEGLTATGDDTTEVVTLKTSEPTPFLLRMASMLPLTCAKGLKSPDSMDRSSQGSGPYELTDIVPNDHYTYTKKRTAYTWGPNGDGVEDGPDKVTFKIIPNETTAANLLLGGQVDIARVNGSDRGRLEAAGIKNRTQNDPHGQLLFNEAPGHATADPRVRWALTAALDLRQIGAVATGGRGIPSTTLGIASVKPCPGDSITGNTPPHDLDRAAETLKAAGWTKSGGKWSKDGHRLSITLPYQSTAGAQVTAAVELAAKQLSSFGVKVTRKPMTPTTVVPTLGSGEWDIAWLPISVALPDQNVPFFDGPALPKGLNFGSTDNPEYRRLLDLARAKPDTAGCAEWTAAEAELIKRVDVISFVNIPTTYYTKGYSFELDGNGVRPSSLHRTGGR